jgi:hypothetical protein
MLGNLVAEERGKIVGVRVLPDGKTEQTGQGSGKWWGVEATNLWTGVSTLRPDGTFQGEGQGLIITKEGDAMTAKIVGVGAPTGPGSAVRYRGAAFVQTASPKLAQASRTALVYEFDSDEKGDYTLKVWEWK